MSAESNTMIERTVTETPPSSSAECSRAIGHYSRTVSFVLQVFGITLVLAAVVVGFARWQTGSNENVWPYLQGQRLFIYPTHIDLGEVATGGAAEIEKVVRVVNLSSNDLTLVGSQASCGCVALEQFPIVIAAQGEHRLRMRILVSGKEGSFNQRIKVFSDDRGYTSTTISVAATIRQ